MSGPQGSKKISLLLPILPLPKISSTTHQPQKLRRLIKTTFPWNSRDLDSTFVGMQPYSMTSSRSKCLAPVPFVDMLTLSRVGAYFQGESKRICTKARRQSRADDYTIMSWAHLLLSEEPKTGEMFSFEQSSHAL